MSVNDDALRDPDSGLLNGDYFRAALPHRVATARRVLRPLSVALLALGDADGRPMKAGRLADAPHLSPDTITRRHKRCPRATGLSGSSSPIRTVTVGSGISPDLLDPAVSPPNEGSSGGRSRAPGQRRRYCDDGRIPPVGIFTLP